jgi:hypothetical protein
MDTEISALVGMYAALYILIDNIEWRELCEATEWDGYMKWPVPYRSRYQFAVPERVVLGNGDHVNF